MHKDASASQTLLDNSVNKVSGEGGHIATCETLTSFFNQKRKILVKVLVCLLHNRSGANLVRAEWTQMWNRTWSFWLWRQCTKMHLLPRLHWTILWTKWAATSGETAFCRVKSFLFWEVFLHFKKCRRGKLTQVNISEQIYTKHNWFSLKQEWCELGVKWMEDDVSKNLELLVVMIILRDASASLTSLDNSAIKVMWHQRSIFWCKLTQVNISEQIYTKYWFSLKQEWCELGVK